MARKYIYGPGIDRPVAMVSGGNGYYYYADALGSVRLITDAAGDIVESYTYDPYGRPSVMVSAGADGNWLTEDAAIYSYSSIGNPYLFTGRRWDSSTSLYYYRFRDYSPALGRFLQPDPIGYADSMNLYQYCLNNPINYIDPWGLRWKYHWWNLPIWPWIGAWGLGETIGEGIEGAYEMYEATQNPTPPMDLDTDPLQDPRANQVEDFKHDAFDAAKAVPNTTFTGPAPAPTNLADVAVDAAMNVVGDIGGKCPGEGEDGGGGE